MEKYINNNTIVEDAIFNEFKDLVTCPLCSNILIDPTMCMKCQKVYCKKCIDNLPQKELKCPNNCSQPNYQKSLGKNEILTKLHFKCEECGNLIKYDEAQKHHNSCSPDKISSNLNKNTNNNKACKFQKISKNEMTILQKKGNDITYITGKKNYYYNLYTFFCLT